MITHKNRRWKIGQTLITPVTKDWSSEEMDRNNEIENRSVYENFNSHDQGRSRKLICVCETKQQAEAVVSDHNQSLSRAIPTGDFITRIMDTDKSYWCKCENCGWEDSSQFCEGGDAIGDTGDYSDPVCPICFSSNIEGDSTLDVPSYEGIVIVKIPLDIYMAPYKKLLKQAMDAEDKRSWDSMDEQFHLVSAHDKLDDILARVDNRINQPFVTPRFGDNWKETAKFYEASSLIDIAWRQGRKALLLEEELKKILELEATKTKDKRTLGQIIYDAMYGFGYTHKDVSAKTRLQQDTVINLTKDEIYTNTVPILLLKKLLIFLSIPFEQAANGIRKTFDVLEEKKQIGEYDLRKFAILWENETAMEKYISRLEELMQSNG